MDGSKRVWIKNNHIASIRIRAEYKEGNEVKELVIEFPRERVNRITQIVEENGYINISAEEFEILKEGSKIFKAFIDKQTLVVFDEPPEEAYSDAQRISILETKVTELQAVNMELLAKLEGSNGSSGDTAVLQGQIESLLAGNEELAKQNTELSHDNAELKAAKEALETEFQTYKNEFPRKEAEAKVEKPTKVDKKE